LEPQTLHEFLEWEPEYPASIIGDGVLYDGDRLFLYGKQKSFKSMLALNLGLSVAFNEPWLGFETGCASVLYLQTEVPHFWLRNRLDKMMHSWVSRAHANGDIPICVKCGKKHQELHFWTEPYIKLDSPSGLAILQKHLEKLKPKLLIIDPLYKVVSGNILDPNVIRDFGDTMDIMRDKHKFTLVVIAHSRKGEIDPAEWSGDDLMGPALLSAWADNVLRVVRRGGKNDLNPRLLVTFDMLRHAQKPIEDMEVTLNSDTLEFQKTLQSDRLPNEITGLSQKENNHNGNPSNTG
jgi:hypothetical protein